MLGEARGLRPPAQHVSYPSPFASGATTPRPAVPLTPPLSQGERGTPFPLWSGRYPAPSVREVIGYVNCAGPLSAPGSVSGPPGRLSRGASLASAVRPVTPPRAIDSTADDGMITIEPGFCFIVS
jgi:hypothetical protein